MQSLIKQRRESTNDSSDEDMWGSPAPREEQLKRKAEVLKVKSKLDSEFKKKRRIGFLNHASLLKILKPILSD